MGFQWRVVLLLALLTGLLVAVGGLLGGSQGATTFFIIALAMNFFSYWYSDRLALMMTGARELTRRDAPQLYAMVEELSRRAGLPTPRLYIIESHQPNAFATGRGPSHSAVAVTRGLLGLMNREELEGVIAHELAHIKNRDVLLSTIAASIAGAISMLANVAQWRMIFGGYSDDEEGAGNFIGALIAIIVAPLAALLIQMAISRSREFLADATGARIAGSPRGLASALRKLDQAARAYPMDVNPGTAHLFIVNPLRGEALLRLFSTHPPIEERIRRLLGNGKGVAA